MSKFLSMCEHIERMLKEEGEIPDFGTSAPPQAVPGEPVGGPIPTIDPETDSQVKDVNNTKIEELIETIVDFYQKGRALSSDSINAINKLPAKINSENSEQTVETLIALFNQSDMPIDTSGSEA